MGGRTEAWLKALSQPVDGAFLEVFRGAFGILMFFGACRYWAKGWIDSILIAPRFHFHYAGFGWVEPLPGVGMYVVFLLMALGSLGIAFGRWYRVSAWAFFLTFIYVELCEKAAYLNHYYLVSLFALLLLAMPSRTDVVPRWVLLALRLQIGLVYFFAGFAKISSDWLIHALPLTIWFRAQSDLPVIGSLLEAKGAAHVAAWVGMLLDLTAPLWLSLQRTRIWAYLALVLFHLATASLFPVGLFPWLMILSATVFFDPGWPRRFPWLRQWLAKPAGKRPSGRVSPAFALAFAAYFALQFTLPVRFLFLPGTPNWSDEGFRFSWRVMLIDKLGTVRFRLPLPGKSQPLTLEPRDYLTPFQERMMAQSPDMIVELAHHIAAQYEREFGRFPAVYTDAWVVLNGRASQRFIDPNVDLTTVSASGFQPLPVLQAPQ